MVAYCAAEAEPALAKKTTFVYDLVDVGRQALAKYSSKIMEKLSLGIAANDTAVVKAQGADLLSLLDGTYVRRQRERTARVVRVSSAAAAMTHRSCCYAANVCARCCRAGHAARVFTRLPVRRVGRKQREARDNGGRKGAHAMERQNAGHFLGVSAAGP